MEGTSSTMQSTLVDGVDRKKNDINSQIKWYMYREEDKDADRERKDMYAPL
jgi:hypothetical protein